MTFREVLSDQTIRVLVRAALPGTVGCGEVEGDAGGALDLFVAVELCAIVDRDALEEVSLFADQLNDATVQFGLGVVGKLGDQQAAGRPFHERDDAMFRPCAADRIHLPVTDLAAEFDPRRSLGDMPLSSQSAAPLIGAVALAVPRALTQPSPQIASLTFVMPDVLVDGLVTDLEQAMSREPAADLFGAEIGAEKCLDNAPLLVGELTVLARAAPPAVCGFLRSKRPVRAITMRAVAPDLTVNRAPIALHQPRDLF